MKKHHQRTLKFHTLFTVLLAVICVGVIVLNPSWILAVTSLFLIAYVAGNGIIHTRKNQLTRDSLFEYIVVAIIAGLIIVGAVVH